MKVSYSPAKSGLRREIARIAVEKLIMDGRIHPARIEEMVAKAQKEVNAVIKAEGERAVFETNIHGLNPEIIKLLGRMRYRTSYGQNVLNHSIEVSHIAGLLASELGVDVNVAKRAGLLQRLGMIATGFHQNSPSTLLRGNDSNGIMLRFLILAPSIPST